MKLKIVSCNSDMGENRAHIQTNFSGNMVRLNFLFAIKVYACRRFVSRIYGVAIGDNDKSDKEEKG